MQPACNDQQDHEVAQPDLKDPVKAQGLGALEIRGEPGPDHHREDEVEETLRHRVPAAQEILQ